VLLGINALIGCAALPSTATPSPTLTRVALGRILKPNESFDPLPEPSQPEISRARAIELAQTGLTGTLTSASAEYGRLRSPQLGTRSDRFAWFVTLEGLAPPAPRGGPQPTGARRTFAFVDAEDGRPLISVSEGAGP